MICPVQSQTCFLFTASYSFTIAFLSSFSVQTMINTISKFSDSAASYAAQSLSAPTALAKMPGVLKESARPAALDTYERADGSTATRNDAVKSVKAPSSVAAKTDAELPEDEQKFKELLHQFVGQVLFGQMLKSMRATQEKNPYFNGGRAEEIFQGQLDQVLTDKMTKATSKTLSDPMYKLMRAPKAG